MSRLLALETTDVSGSVALCENGQVLVSRFLCSEQRSAQSLVPTIQTLLNEQGWRSTDVDVVAVTTGPGSFTGLRVGVATAKMFAWAIDAKVIGIDTLDAIVASLIHSDACNIQDVTILTVGVDAQRGDSAVRYYLLTPNLTGVDVTPLNKSFHVVSMKKWLGFSTGATFLDSVPFDVCEEIKELATTFYGRSVDALKTYPAKNVLYVGPALRRVKNLTVAYPEVCLCPETCWNPDARGVALVAAERVLRGIFDDVWNLLPFYSRRPAAEEKALEKQKTLQP